MPVLHWAAKYIGLPWESGAQGPYSFDCWGFVRWVQREHFGRELPQITVDLPRETDRDRRLWTLSAWRLLKDNDERAHWRLRDRTEVPTEGDAVEMAHNRHPLHVGVWIDADGGGILHCAEGHGVSFHSPLTLRVSGWGRIRYYERAA